MLFLSLQESTNEESWNKPVCPNNPVLLLSINGNAIAF